MQHSHLRHPEASRLPGALQQHYRYRVCADQRGIFHLRQEGPTAASQLPASLVPTEEPPPALPVLQ